MENAFSKDASKRFGGWFVRFNGMKVTFTIGNEKGKRVQSVTIKGKSLEKEKLYTITACERDGDPVDTLCRMTNVSNPISKQVLLHEVIEDYLTLVSPISPKLEGRAVATDAAPTLLTQVTPGTNYQFR